jgi:ABC-2 type transport system ATP-binding protein
MEEAEVCDKIAIIDRGRIITSGTPAELKKLIGGDVIYLKTTDNKKAIEDIKNLLEVEVSERDGEIFISAPRGDVCIPKIIREIGESVLSVRMQRPTLNDVFLKLTGKEIRTETAAAGDDIKSAVRSYRRRHDRG